MRTDHSMGRSPSIRWWPAIILLLGFAVAMCVVWGVVDQPRQSSNIATAVISIITLALLSLWWLLFSRIKLSLRFVSFAVVLGLGFVISRQLEVVGVSGDLVPILGWRQDQAPATEDLKATVTEGAVQDISEPTLLETMDFPQFLGPTRDTQIALSVRDKINVEREPEKLWQVNMGGGWSGFVVQGGRAVTQQQRQDQEVVSCFDLGSGQVLWESTYQAAYESVIAGDGPRSTPTIANGKVLCMGSTGELSCLDLVTGQLLWRHHVVNDNGATIPEWGFSPSPLVVDDEVIVPAGEKGSAGLVAYNLEDGSQLRAYPYVKSSYSSPIMAKLGETSQIIYFFEGGLAGFDRNKPELLWKMEWGSAYPDVAVPILLSDERLFISSGYGVGCALVGLQKEPDAWQAKVAWKGRSMKAKFSNMSQRDGYIYGLDDGIMACIELEKGRRQWKEGRFGHGQILMFQDAMLVTAEDGRIIWMEINPDEPKILQQWQALEGKSWNPPCVAWPYLLIRNDQQAICYRLEG